MKMKVVIIFCAPNGSGMNAINLLKFRENVATSLHKVSYMIQNHLTPYRSRYKSCTASFLFKRGNFVDINEIRAPTQNHFDILHGLDLSLLDL